MKNGKLRAMASDALTEMGGGHTSLARERAVHMAGTFETNAEGLIKEFGNFSGHYVPQQMPGFRSLEGIAREAFKRHGIPQPGPNTWVYYVPPWLR
jgi:hypothetical protein